MCELLKTMVWRCIEGSCFVVNREGRALAGIKMYYVFYTVRGVLDKPWITGVFPYPPGTCQPRVSEIIPVMVLVDIEVSRIHTRTVITSSCSLATWVVLRTIFGFQANSIIGYVQHCTFSSRHFLQYATCVKQFWR